MIKLFSTILIFCIYQVSLAQTPCKVLQKEISKTYTGDCKKGLAHGYGIAQGIDKYEGKFKNGLPHGVGKYFWASGEIYDGHWKNGKKNGEGKFIFKVNGVDSIRAGIWKNDFYFKKITPKSYRVIKSNGIMRYTIYRIDNGARVLFKFQRQGGQFSPNNLMLTSTSGNHFMFGTLPGYENVSFPITCRVSFSDFNKQIEFEIEISESGSWEVVIAI